MWQLTESICTKSDLADQIVQTWWSQPYIKCATNHFFRVENLCFQVQCSSTAYTGSSALQLHLIPVDIIVVDSDGLTGIHRIE